MEICLLPLHFDAKDIKRLGLLLVILRNFIFRVCSFLMVKNTSFNHGKRITRF